MCIRDRTAVPTENVRANRGANGIDGQISTFLGASARCARALSLIHILLQRHVPSWVLSPE